MSDANKAIFLSYASQDAEAARRIAGALRTAGVEVWFDTDGGLEHGDEWDAKIRRQIKECVLFIPLISANTQAREEGYFRLEWDLAAERARTIASGVAFILPVVVDDTREPAALVPDRFRTVQWTKLPGGNVSPEVLHRFLKLWSHRTGALKQAAGAVSNAEPGSARVLPALKRPAVWLVPLGIALLAAAGLVLWRASPKPDATPAVAPLSVARELAAKARSLLAAGRVVSRETLGAADDLAAQALKLDPTDAEVLATSAQVDAFMVYRGFDISEARRQSAAKRAQRALALDPGSFEARHARAVVAGFLAVSPEMLAEAEHIYRELWQERPADNVIGQELGRVLQEENRPADAAAVFLQAKQPLDAGWAYFAGGQFQEADKVADRMLTEKRDALTFVLKANVQLLGFGDIAAAQAAVDELTPTDLMNDDAAGIALRVAVLRRDGARILKLLSAFSNPFVSIGVNYPRQYWTGYAQTMLGHPEAARSEWHAALQAVEERLKSNPTDAESLGWVAMLQALLGDKEAAGHALQLYLNYSPVAPGRWNWWQGLTILHVGGRNDEVLEMLSGALREWHGGNRILYLFARTCPEFDPLRADPRFETLLRETLPAGMKPFTATTGQPAGVKVDDKSVAVLAFANLSDDKANEYFSDGISEELLNVLAKISGLKVAARTSAFYFKGKEVPIPEISRQLGVAYVVEGSVRKQGDKVRITAQLIKASDGFHVWSDTFTRDLKDIFAVQDEIARLIAENLSLKLGMTPSAAHPVDPEAYRLLTLGRGLAYRGSGGDLDQAVKNLQDAVARDDRFALGWAWLSIAQGTRAAVGQVPIESGNREARAAAERALALDPDLAEAHMAIGLIYSVYDRDWARARSAFQRAAVLVPGDAAVTGNLCRLAVTLGESDEAIRLGRRAVELDPLSNYAEYALGMALFQAGRFEELADVLKDFSSLNPGHVKLQVFLRLMQGKNEDALQATERVAAANYNRPFLVAMAQWACGRPAEADVAMNRLKTEAADRAAYQIAQLYAQRGATDEAFTWLETAYRLHDAGMIWLKNDPWLKSLHVDPRWPVLLRKMHLADEQLP